MVSIYQRKINLWKTDGQRIVNNVIWKPNSIRKCSSLFEIKALRQKLVKRKCMFHVAVANSSSMWRKRRRVWAKSIFVFFSIAGVLSSSTCSRRHLFVRFKAKDPRFLLFEYFLKLSRIGEIRTHTLDLSNYTCQWFRFSHLTVEVRFVHFCIV